jgi:murein DD-endopeptidase MepM/ murein hydrolase activator NlpD
VPRRASRPVVSVDRRPWRVLIVSAAPGSAPRSFDLPRWQARAAIVLVSLVTVLALAFIAAVVVAVRSPDLLGEPGEATALRRTLAATRDSLAVLRASVDAVAASSGDEGADAAEAADSARIAAEAPSRTPAARTSSRPRVTSARAARATGLSEPRPLLAMPAGLSELPVIGALVSGFSLARRHPLLHVTRPHLGVDLAAPRGTRVSAPAAGRVRFVGHKFGFGLVVELDHGDGITTRYAHLRSSAVELGERVTRGEAIAAVGTSGITTGPHLHYEVLVRGRQVDPLTYHFASAVTPPSGVATQVGPAAGSAIATPPSSGVGSGTNATASRQHESAPVESAPR